MDITFDNVVDAYRCVADAMGVEILQPERLKHDLAMDWDTVTSKHRTYRYAVHVVERCTSAQEFRALEFAQRTADYLDVQLQPFFIPTR